jgi:hypothetical protein
MTERDDSATFVREMLRILGGVLVWAAQLGFVYGANAVICNAGLEPGLAIAVVEGASVIAAAGAVVLLYRALARRRGAELAAARFSGTLAALVAGLSLVAIVWTGVVGLVVPPCPLERTARPFWARDRAAAHCLG